MPFIEKSDFSTLPINQLGQPPSRVLLSPHRRIWPTQTRLCRPRELGMGTQAPPISLPVRGAAILVPHGAWWLCQCLCVSFPKRCFQPGLEAGVWKRWLEEPYTSLIWKKKSIRKDINKPSLTESSSRPFRDVWPWSRYPAINESTWHG